MSLYHFSMDQITRGEAHAVVNNAAYRAGEKYHDERYGEIWDYTHKQGVMYKEIFLPEHAPKRLQDRETLWNEVEAVEKHPRAQLAHNIEFSLQNELSLEENIEVARKYVREVFVAKGMIVDLCVHQPHRDDPEEPDNPHVHLLIPIRPLREDGTWGNKQKRVYETDVEGNPVYEENGKRKYTAVSLTGWSEKQALEEYRESYATYFNAKFEEKGLTCRIDHRSYAERGIDLIPQIHEGPAVGKMEKRGIVTEKRAINLLIKSINTSLIRLRELLDRAKVFKEELRLAFAEREKEPGMADLLNAYFGQRNAVASIYAYGQKKAAVTNVKMHSQMINELMERNISSVHDLEMEINKVEGKLEKVAGKVRRQSSDIKELTNLLRLNDYYKTYRPLYLEMNKIWFKSRKENFRKEHEAELNKYYVAENKLKAYRKDGKLPIAQWKKQLEEAKEIRAEDISQRDEIRQELEMLQKIYDALDQGLAILRAEGGAYGGRNSVERYEDDRGGNGRIRGSRAEEDFLTKGNQFDRSTESNQRRNSGREKQSVLEQLHEKQAQQQPKSKKKRSHDMSL